MWSRRSGIDSRCKLLFVILGESLPSVAGASVAYGGGGGGEMGLSRTCGKDMLEVRLWTVACAAIVAQLK